MRTPNRKVFSCPKILQESALLPTKLNNAPAADKLAARIRKEIADKPEYILDFHVDSWNRLGWKDVFSDPKFTKRQRQYASLLKLSTVYTPQAVVDVHTEFVVAQEATMRKAIAVGLARKVSSKILLKDVKSAGATGFC